MVRDYVHPVASEQSYDMEKRASYLVGTVKNKRRYNFDTEYFQRRVSKRGGHNKNSILVYLSSIRTHKGCLWSVYFGPQSRWNQTGSSTVDDTILSATIDAFINALDIIDSIIEIYPYTNEIVFVTDQLDIERSLTEYDYLLGADEAPCPSTELHRNELTHIHYGMLALSNTGISCHIWLASRDEFGPALRLASTHSETTSDDYDISSSSEW